MDSPIDIRPAGEGDRDAVLRLLLAQLREHAIATPDEEIAAGVDGVLRRPQRGRFLLALAESDEAVGLAALSFLWSFEHGGRAAWLDELYVVPELRGRGTGAALVRAACAVARGSGARAVDLEVDAGHRRAAGLYAREGFRRHDRERWFQAARAARAAEARRSATLPGSLPLRCDPLCCDGPRRGDRALPLRLLPTRRRGSGRHLGDLSRRSVLVHRGDAA